MNYTPTFVCRAILIEPYGVLLPVNPLNSLNYQEDYDLHTKSIPLRLCLQQLFRALQFLLKRIVILEPLSTLRAYINYRSTCHVSTEHTLCEFRMLQPLFCAVQLFTAAWGFSSIRKRS